MRDPILPKPLEAVDVIGPSPDHLFGTKSATTLPSVHVHETARLDIHPVQRSNQLEVLRRDSPPVQRSNQVIDVNAVLDPGEVLRR